MAHPKAGRPVEPPPVKYFAALLAGDGVDLDRNAFPALEALFGSIDYRGNAHPFDKTDYYGKEMGAGLRRIIVSFAGLRPATEIVRFKHGTAGIEASLSAGGCRRVNIDPGYLDYFKVVLASFKEGPQKIYLGEGVYADTVLLYQHGAFDLLPWSFPDFREGLYMDDFGEIRRLYKRSLRR